MTELVHSAGVTAYLILLIAGLGVPIAIATVVLTLRPKTLRVSLILAGVLLGLGGATLLLGAQGRVLGRMASYRAVAQAPDEAREALLAEGFEESSANTTLGGMVGGPLALLGAAVLAAGFARRQGAS